MKNNSKEKGFIHSKKRDRVREIFREYLLNLPRRFLDSITVDLGAVRRSLLCNSGRDIVLLYGYYGTIYELLGLATFLSQKGYKVHVPHYDSLKPTKEAAKDVYEYIKRLNLESYILIGHSKGGIIAKYLVSKHEDVFKSTKKIFTIATPHRGTFVAFLPFPNSFELRYGSPFLSSLATKEIEEKIIAISNRQDMVIVPLSSQKVKYGKNIEVDVWGHANCSSDPKTLSTIWAQLQKI